MLKPTMALSSTVDALSFSLFLSLLLSSAAAGNIFDDLIKSVPYPGIGPVGDASQDMGAPATDVPVDSSLPAGDVLPIPAVTYGKNGGEWIVAKPDPSQGPSGTWSVISENSGVSAMHLAIMKHGKAVMFDTTVFGTSRIQLKDQSNCPVGMRANVTTPDCFAHAVEFDYNNGNVRPLKVTSDTWCSSGGFDKDGTLVQTGGYFRGNKAARYLKPCDSCDWEEHQFTFAAGRWYATQQILPDGGFIVVGGRRSFSYEFVPPAGQQSGGFTNFRFLRDTNDEEENNLYPFVFLLPDGNLFVFANDRGVVLDPKTRAIVRQLPVLPGGARNYPASGMSVLLPLDLRRGVQRVNAEVLICGGARKDAFANGENDIYLPALKDCGRISLSKPNAGWRFDQMPMPRTMGDMLLLPTGEALIINGAARGSSGWLFARDPVLTPLIYSPKKKRGNRFRALAATTIPRMYHSTSALLPDATILVAGGNTNNGYKFQNVDFPTDLRVEKFAPPYLDPSLAGNRADIDERSFVGAMNYGKPFSFKFTTPKEVVARQDTMVTIYAPPFTTHGFSQNQRMLILKVETFGTGYGRVHDVTVTGPPSGAFAPPGYYFMFVVVKGVPSKAVWIKIN